MEDRFGSIDEIECPAIQELCDHWSGLRKGDSSPLAADFDVLDIYDIAPWIGLIDVIEGGKDYHFRMVGTKLVRTLREELTGKLLRDYTDDQTRNRLVVAFGRVVESTDPLCICGLVGDRGGRVGVHVESVVLPLLDGDGAISRLIYMIRLRKIDGSWMD